MYLTAQKVRASTGPEGINAFLSMHREQPIPLRALEIPDIDHVTQFAGGYFVAEEVQLTPGGNAVTAYLDVVAPDEVKTEDLRVVIGEIEKRVGTVVTPVTVEGGGIAARFSAIIELENQHAEQRGLLQALWAAAEPLLKHRNDPVRIVRGPYIVWAGYAFDGLRLWLPPVTLQRLPQSPSRRLRIFVPNDVMHTPNPPFNIVRETARSLLGIEEAAVSREGGIEIVDPRTATVLASFTGP